MIIQRILVILVACSVLVFSYQMENSFTDTRDGKTYNTVKIGSQVWMAENLNYQTNGSKCFLGKISNCDTYGRLYTWSDAQNVCPSGWHLPSKKEIEKLLHSVGGAVGPALRSRSGWRSGGNGRDEYGFGALPAGYYVNYGNLTGDVGYYAQFWSSTEIDSGNAYLLTLHYVDNQDYVYHRDKHDGYSVRCVKSSNEDRNTLLVRPNEAWTVNAQNNGDENDNGDDDDQESEADYQEEEYETGMYEIDVDVENTRQRVTEDIEQNTSKRSKRSIEKVVSDTTDVSTPLTFTPDNIKDPYLYESSDEKSYAEEREYGNSSRRNPIAALFLDAIASIGTMGATDEYGNSLDETQVVFGVGGFADFSVFHVALGLLFNIAADSSFKSESELHNNDDKFKKYYLNNNKLGFHFKAGFSVFKLKGLEGFGRRNGQPNWEIGFKMEKFYNIPMFYGAYFLWRPLGELSLLGTFSGKERFLRLSYSITFNILNTTW